MRFLKGFVFISVLAIAAGSAGASTFVFEGQARLVGMGGAGLALTDDSASGSLVNPAVPAAAGTRLRFIFPSVDFHTRGVSFSDITGKTSEISSGDQDDALTLAKDFGGKPTGVSFGFVTGFEGRYGVTAEGEAEALINPGGAFTQWVRAGLPTDAAGFGAAVLNGSIADPGFVAAINAALADGNINGSDAANIANAFVSGTSVIGRFVYAAPAVSYSTGMNAGSGRLYIGTKMRWLKSESHTWAFQQQPGVTNAVDLQGQEDLTQLKKDSGFGMDLGFLYRHPKSRMQYALVVDNFIEPKLDGIPADNMWSAGVGWQPVRGITVAADLFNINKAFDESTDLRLGAEWKLGSLLALRMGRNNDGFAWGFRLLGFDFAFAEGDARMLSRSLAF